MSGSAGSNPRHTLLEQGKISDTAVLDFPSSNNESEKLAYKQLYHVLSDDHFESAKLMQGDDYLGAVQLANWSTCKRG